MKRIFMKHIMLLIFSIAYLLLPAQNQIVGTVLYHNNESNPIYDVNLNLLNSSNNIVASTVTNMYGEFEFNNIPNGDFKIVANTNLPVGDINIVDASMILEYLLGFRTFTDYEFAAADVNESGNITFGDYILVLVSYLLQGNPFPGNDWQFEAYNVSFNSRDLSSSSDTTRIYATSIGDVEGIWMPTGRKLTYADSEYIETKVSGEYAEVSVTSNYENEISGYHIDLVYPNQYIEIIDITGFDENLHYEIDNEQGIINVAWLNETPEKKVSGNKLFTIKVKALNNTELDDSHPISIYNNATILDNESNIIENVTIKLPKITTANYELNVISYPNPTISNLNIEITSPCDDIANIKIFDISGRLVNTIENQSITKGSQLINANTETLPVGTYLYTIDFNKNSTIKGRFNKAD